MYFSSTTTASSILALAALSAAAPAPHEARQVPHYPPNSLSKGFKFVANVTDPARDLTPSVDGWVLDGVHVGAANSAAVLNPQGSGAGRLFYHNGTSSDLIFETSQVLSDGGSPPFPWGVRVQGPDEFDLPANPGFHASYITAGSSLDVGITKFPNPYSILRNRKAGGSGTFVACNNTIAYYQQKFITVDYVYATIDPATSLPVVEVPQGCAPIALVPQCDVLNDLPADAVSSHEFAVDQKCYEDVAAIDWSLYGP